MGPFFSKARYMNGVGFEILARTPVPKLPLSYHPEVYLVFNQSGIPMRFGLSVPSAVLSI